MAVVIDSALIDRAVDRALDFLAGQQLESGQFRMQYTLLAGYGVREPEVHEEKSPFCSSYLAHVLCNSNDARARQMLSRVLDFLQREQERGGLWRYWTKDAPLHDQIPPDVDDTACISDVLRIAKRPVPNNRALLLANRDRRGLFYTWITPRATLRASPRWWWLVLSDSTYGRLVTFWRAGAKRDDVDTVVNANVLLYLGDRLETQPVVKWLIENARSANEENSDRWYRSRTAFYYALSRCYARGLDHLAVVKPELQRSFGEITHRDGRIGNNPLETALATVAMLNFDYWLESLRPSIDYLLAAQGADGGWDSIPFYHDYPNISWGSRAVTTGFCVEALLRSAA